jgi:hypothetical protein
MRKYLLTTVGIVGAGYYAVANGYVTFTPIQAAAHSRPI